MRIRRHWRTPFAIGHRFLSRKGILAASGLAFQGLFSLFAVLWLLFVVLNALPPATAVARGALVAIINQFVPYLIGNQHGIVSLISVQAVNLGGWRGVPVACILLLVVLGFVSLLRNAARLVYGLDEDADGFWGARIRDACYLVGFVLLVCLLALINWGLTYLLGFAPLPGWMVAGGQFMIAVGSRAILDWAVLFGIMLLLARLPGSRRRLLAWSVAGALLLTTLQTLGGIIFTPSWQNPLAASLTVAIGLLTFLYINCIVLLLAVAGVAVTKPSTNN